MSFEIKGSEILVKQQNMLKSENTKTSKNTVCWLDCSFCLTAWYLYIFYLEI